ncbi:hypothetical protein BaRGS_00022607, partial [Batillaria attramentaria]
MLDDNHSKRAWLASAHNKRQAQHGVTSYSLVEESSSDGAEVKRSHPEAEPT